MARQNEPPGDDPANDNYKNLGDPLEETLNQLQILEHIEYSPEGLSPGDRALKERLEKQEIELRAGKDIKDIARQRARENEAPEYPEQHDQDMREFISLTDADKTRWQRAELLLETHARISKSDVHPYDVPQPVVVELLKDIMHYCQSRSEGMPIDSPEHLDFNALVQLAKKELRAEMRQAEQIFPDNHQPPEKQEGIHQSPQPANDNEHPDDPWQRAEIILHAHSGADMTSVETAKEAMTNLLVDMMHYSAYLNDVIRVSAKETRPEPFDFEDLIDHATENFWVQEDTMNPQIEAEAKRSAKAFAEKMSARKNEPPEQIPQLSSSEATQLAAYLADNSYSRHMAGLADDAKLAPELQKRLKELYDRQRQQADELREETRRQHDTDGEPPDVLKTHNEEFKKQYARFAQERERYVSNYNAVQAPDSPGFFVFGKYVNSAGKELLDGLRDAGQISRTDTEKPKEAAMPGENQFTAKVPFTQDPEYIKLMRDLQLRQEQDTKELVKKQTEQRIAFGRQPGVTREQLDENDRQHLQQRDVQSKTHKAETDRRTRDYHDAKVLRIEIEQREALEKSLRQGDTPEHTK